MAANSISPSRQETSRSSKDWLRNHRARPSRRKGGNGRKEIFKMTDVLMTRQEVAQFFQVAPETVLRWVRAGKLKETRITFKTIRYLSSDVEAFIAAQNGSN
jgi:aspartate carbamoyltransferase regulatory subunit